MDSINHPVCTGFIYIVAIVFVCILICVHLSIWQRMTKYTIWSFSMFFESKFETIKVFSLALLLWIEMEQRKSQKSSVCLWWKQCVCRELSWTYQFYPHALKQKHDILLGPPKLFFTNRAWFCHYIAKIFPPRPHKIYDTGFATKHETRGYIYER